MKSKEVIDKIEKTLPVKLRPCRYCRGESKEHIREDVNYRGDKGYFATVRCTSCGISVEAFADDKHSASVMARSYWEKGICDV